jgi:hypothetical protein
MEEKVSFASSVLSSTLRINKRRKKK